MEVIQMNFMWKKKCPQPGETFLLSNYIIIFAGVAAAGFAGAAGALH